MHVLEVGQPYNPGRTRWPETPHLRLTPGGCELVLFLGHPSAAEVRDVRTGIAQFTWTDGGPVSVLCVRFGTLPWMDTPHEPWREAEAVRGTPAGGPGTQLALQVGLGDARPRRRAAPPARAAGGLRRRPHRAGEGPAAADLGSRVRRSRPPDCAPPAHLSPQRRGRRAAAQRPVRAR